MFLHLWQPKCSGSVLIKITVQLKWDFEKDYNLKASFIVFRLENSKDIIFFFFNFSRLVFNSDEVGVGVVIRGVDYYDLMQIKQQLWLWLRDL